MIGIDKKYLVLILLFFNISFSYSFSLEITPENNTIVNNLNQTIRGEVTGSGNVSTWINWDNSLVAYWNFESGGADLSGNGNHGTFYDGMGTVSSGKMGRGTRCDGTNDDFRSTDLDYGPGNQMSVAVWAKPNETGQGYIVTKHQYVTDNPFTIYYDNDSNRYSFRAGTNGISSSNNYYNHEWRHIVGVYNGTHSKIYIDGELENTGASSPTFNDASLKLCDHSSPQYPYGGYIDEVMVFDRAISNEEIRSIFNSQVNDFRFNASNLLNNTKYNYTMFSINESGYLLKETYNFYTDTSYISPTSSFFPSFGLINIMTLLICIGLYFRKK